LFNCVTVGIVECIAHSWPSKGTSS
jgi:hypothetical protein